MSDHDPLCPIASRPKNATLICECFFIAKARADERKRIAQAIEAERVARGKPRTDLAVGWYQGLNKAARIARNGGRDA